MKLCQLFSKREITLIGFVFLPIILSCAVLQNAVTPLPESTPTALNVSPTFTITPKPELITPTPTLGAKSIWRNSKIAFASNRSGGFQIYLMKPDGSELTQITNAAGDNRSPAWSLDAKHIAFVSTRDGNKEIYVMNPDGTNQVNISNNPADEYLPVWFPQDRIAFVSNRDGNEKIYIMNADGSEIKPLTKENFPAPKQVFCLADMGGGLLSFTLDASDQRDVWVVDINTHETWQPSILNDNGERSCPSTSFNGSWTFVISNRDGHDEIYKLDTQNGTEIQLTNNSVESLGPSSSTASGWVVFYSQRNGNWEIYMMRDDGKNQWNITNNSADDVEPVWEPY